MFNIHTFYHVLQITWLLRSNKVLCLAYLYSNTFTEIIWNWILLRRNKDKRTQKIQETKIKSSRTKVFFLHRKDYSLLSFAALASYHLNHYTTSTPHSPDDLIRSSNTHSKYHQHPQSLLLPYAKALQIPIVTALEFSPLQDRCCCCLEEIVSCLENQQQVQASEYCRLLKRMTA